ncbi:MAG TPA: hypothetical protein VIQ22_00700, partial [Gammaproteobacteria bacterium]
WTGGATPPARKARFAARLDELSRSYRVRRRAEAGLSSPYQVGQFTPAGRATAFLLASWGIILNNSPLNTTSL